MTIEDRIEDHNAHIIAERVRLEREVKRAIDVIGIRRVVKLCADHADARVCEACNAQSKRNWALAQRKLNSIFNWMRHN